MLKKITRVCFFLFLLALCWPLAGFGGQGRVVLLYTTDTHGRLISNNDIIGMDVISALKKHTPDALLVDTGDYLQGNPLVNLGQGENAVRLMKAAGYDVVGLGNHEFDFGLTALGDRLSELAAVPNPVRTVAANILNADGTAFIQPSTIIDINGLKVGVFGLTTETTVVQTHPKNVRGLQFTDVTAAAQKAADELRAKGCDIVVALAHVGTERVIGTKSTDIAAGTKGIDVIIDGHTHVVVDQTLPNGTTVVSSGAHAKNVGRLTLTRTGAGTLEKENVLLGKADVAGLTPDAAVSDLLEEMQARQKAQLGEVIGFAEAHLEAERALIRTQQTNLGDLCADSLVHMTGADIAIINSGGIRNSIRKGPITKGDIITTMPFADAVVTKIVTGRQLVEILEHGLRALPRESGGFPQTSGLHLIVDATKPAGDRIVAIRLADGTPVSMEKTYVLAVTDFLGHGGDGYPVLPALPILKLWMAPDTALINFIGEKGTGGYVGPMKPRMEVRTATSGSGKSSCAPEPAYRLGEAG